MATELIELGYAHRTPFFIGRDSPQIVSPLVHLYDLVNTFEDPLAGTGVSREELTPEGLAIIDHIHNLSKKARRELVFPARMGELSAAHELCMFVGELGKKKGLLRKLGKIHKAVFRKISKVVKSPAFLSVAAMVVNVVPGVGQVASVGLAAAAASRKVYEQKAGQKKAVKKAKEADVAAAAQYRQQLVDYNRKTKAYYDAQGIPVPANQYLDATGNPTSDPTKVPGLESAPPPTQAQIAQAVALSTAAGLHDPSQAQGANTLLMSIPPDLAQQAAQYVPAMADIAKDPNLKPATLKAVGQFVAMQEVSEGSGAGPLGGEAMGNLAQEIVAQGGDDVQKAIAAGEQDLITAGSVEGADQAAAVKAAISNGRKVLTGGGGGFPTVPVLIGAGGLVVIGGIVLLAS
jgi:hypothetical protein